MQIDFAYDVEIRTFGEKTKLIKPYRITDFSFLDAENAEVEFPPVNHTQSALDTIEAFRGITVNEGRTKDKEMWGNVIDGYGETEKALLKNGNITELILHISDGDISETGDVVALINHLKEECRVSTAGLAIGDEGAAEALRQRHGPDNVIPANTPAEIVRQFGVLLKKMMEETVQNPMIEHINNT